MKPGYKRTLRHPLSGEPVKPVQKTLVEVFGEKRIAAARAEGAVVRAELPVLDRLGSETRATLSASQRRQLRAGTPAGQAALKAESAYVTAAHEGANKTDRAVKTAREEGDKALRLKQEELDRATRQHEAALARQERDIAVAAAKAEGEKAGRTEERQVTTDLTKAIATLAEGLNHGNGVDGRGSRK